MSRNLGLDVPGFGRSPGAIGKTLFRKTREGRTVDFKKHPARKVRWGHGPGSVDPRFPAGLPFLLSEILEFVAFRDSGTFLQAILKLRGLSRSFPRKNPKQTHSLLEFSD